MARYPSRITSTSVSGDRTMIVVPGDAL